MRLVIFIGNTCYNRFMAFTQSVRNRLTNTSKLTYALLFVTIWLVAALYAWFHVVYQSPESVFKDMLKNNFATTGYTREGMSSQGDVESKEVTQLLLGKDSAVLGATKLTQGTDEVNTNTITTTEKNYVQYASIKTDRKGKSGKPMDFSKVIGVWAATDGQNAGGNQAVSQMMLGLIPIGNLTPKDRSELLALNDKTKAITTDYNTVKKETKNGRLQYTYQVKIKPVAYLELLKKYGQAAGLGEDVAALNPNDYKDTPTTTVQLTVDARSRHLVSVTPPGQIAADEKYSSFGITKAVQIPKNTISTTELQERLNVQ